MTNQRDSDVREKLVEAAIADGRGAVFAEVMADEAMGSIRQARGYARLWHDIRGSAPAQVSHE